MAKYEPNPPGDEPAHPHWTINMSPPKRPVPVGAKIIGWTIVALLGSIVVGALVLASKAIWTAVFA